jgi:hypothetical protein
LHGGRESNLKHFSCWKLLQKSTQILNQSKDARKTGLKELWSDMLIEILITNLTKLHFERDGLHSDLQRLEYDLGDMHILTLKIKEDIEFQRGINAKVNPKKVS